MEINHDAMKSAASAHTSIDQNITSKTLPPLPAIPKTGYQNGPASEPDLAPKSELGPAVALTLQEGLTAIPMDLPGHTMLSELFALAGLKTTPENMKMLQALIRSGLPAGPENLMKLNQAMKLLDNRLDAAMFLLRNDIVPSTQAAQMINGLANGDIRLSSQLQALMEEIASLPQGALKDVLIDKLIDQPMESMRQSSAEGSTLPGKEQSMQTGGYSELAAASLPPWGANDKTTTTTAWKQTALELFLPLYPEQLEEALQSITKNQPELAGPAKEAAHTAAQWRQAIAMEAGTLTRAILAEASGERGLSPEKLLSFMERSLPKATGEDSPVLAKTGMLSLLRHSLGDQSPAFRIAAKIMAQDDKNRQIPGLKEQLTAKLSLALTENEPQNPKAVNRLLNQIRDMAQEIAAPIRQWEPGHRMLTLANDIEKNLTFLEQLKSSTYMQIPLQINGKQTETELYVFQHDPRKKARGAMAGSQSALIALDLAALGHIETYIQKTGDTVICQFRMENEEVEELIRRYIPALSSQLGQTKLTLARCLFQKLDEPFRLTDQEPIIDGSLADPLCSLNGVDCRA